MTHRIEQTEYCHKALTAIFHSTDPKNKVEDIGYSYVPHLPIYYDNVIQIWKKWRWALLCYANYLNPGILDFSCFGKVITQKKLMRIERTTADWMFDRRLHEASQYHLRKQDPDYYSKFWWTKGVSDGTFQVGTKSYF